MARLEKMDDRPGIPPESRRVASGAIVVIMTIATGSTTTTATQLVIRCEPDGRLLAALARPRTDPT
jgi:hypothetical protein